MKLNIILYSVLAIGLVSCSLEKSYISPMGSMFVAPNSFIQGVENTDIGEKTEVITYSSELTNTLSTFPKMSNDEVNKEANILKRQVKNYIYALQEYNINARNTAFSEVENSYKRLQKLRKNLSPDEDTLINRYLVKIKGNINKLEALNRTDSTAVKHD